MILATPIFEQGNLRNKRRKGQHPFQREQRVRQHELQADRVGEPPVYVLRFPELHGQGCSRRPSHCERKQLSEVENFCNTSQYTDQSSSRESGTPADTKLNAQRKRIQASIPAPKSTVAGETRVLIHIDVEKGLDIVRVDIEKNVPKCRLPSSTGTRTIYDNETRDKKGKRVTLC